VTSTYLVNAGDLGSFRVRRGENLLDAALVNGIDLPHDCRSGTCGSCRCAVTAGAVEGGDADAQGAVLACQARIVADVEIVVEETPPVETVAGVVTAIRALSADVVEVAIETRTPLDHFPGQYAKVKFAGFPARCYSPTLPLEGPVDRDGFRLQVKRVRQGRISTALGERIQRGHKVKLTGPFGSAYLRSGRRQRLVLVASGTGFAPIWSIAHAALCEMPDREIVVVVGANTAADFYMSPALWRLVAFPMTQVISVVRHGDPEGGLPVGSPLDHMPALASEDIVYACGAPQLVEGVAARARAAGAACHVDPFHPALGDDEAFWRPLTRAATASLTLLRSISAGFALDPPQL